jgi:hypothetical protein
MRIPNQDSETDMKFNLYIDVYTATRNIIEMVHIKRFNSTLQHNCVRLAFYCGNTVLLGQYFGQLVVRKHDK